MESLANFIENSGGRLYTFQYPSNIFKGKYCPSNTTCAWFNDRLIVNSRLVDYIKIFQNSEINVTGRNLSQDYIYTEDGFNSRNILSICSNGELLNSRECIYPSNKRINAYYKGLEDCRLVVWNNKLYAYGTRWDRRPDKGCICIYELDNDMKPFNEIVVPPQNGSTNCEKNWGAVSDKPFTFVYQNNPLTVVRVERNGACRLICERDYNEKLGTIKGSTQVVRFNEDTYISMVHKNDYYDDNGFKRSDYLTAFVFYDNDLNIKRISDWFVFNSPMCEFTCGLAINGNDVFITYSQLDCTSQLLVTTKEVIENFITHLQYSKNNNTKNVFEYMGLAGLSESNNQNNTALCLYNYTATLFGEDGFYSMFKKDCLIKTYCGIIKRAPSFKDKNVYNNIKNNLEHFVEKYPDCCEFYYLLSLICKMMGDMDNYTKYKEMGDKYKLSMNKWFFKYFNPNYL